MEIRGINYDVGIVVSTQEARENFDLELARREFRIIRDELQCNSIRIMGVVPEVMYQVAKVAAQMGLHVWFTPYLTELTIEEERNYMVECAKKAEVLRKEFPEVEVIFVQGGEYPLFLKGILPGETTEERISDPEWFLTLQQEDVQKRFQEAVKSIAQAVRMEFGGKLTYAAIPGIENPDWSLFDFIAIDHYKAAYSEETYMAVLQELATYDMPIIVMEVGCAGFQGAYEMGSNAHAIVSMKEEWCIEGDYVRDEELQAMTLESALTDIWDSGCVNGVFVFTFCWRHHYRNVKDPHKDLDKASYAIVKPFKDGYGTTYPDLNWEPKKAFYVVKEFYTKH